MVTLAIGTPVISGVWPTIRRMEVHPPDSGNLFARSPRSYAAGGDLAVGLSLFAPSLSASGARPEFAAAAVVVPF